MLAGPKQHKNDVEFSQTSAVLFSDKIDYFLTGAIETMKVEFEGKTYELQDLAQVAKKGKNVLVVNMAGFPQAAVPVMKALRDNTLGLNPSQDGTLITVQLPRLVPITFA